MRRKFCCYLERLFAGNDGTPSVHSMAIDLKVRIKSCNCEDRWCYSVNLCDYFRVRESNMFLAKALRQLDIVSHYCADTHLVKGYRPLPPRGPAGKVPDIYLSKGEASPQPNTTVLKRILGPAAGYCLALLSESPRRKFQMQQPSFQK